MINLDLCKIEDILISEEGNIYIYEGFENGNYLAKLIEDERGRKIIYVGSYRIKKNGKIPFAAYDEKILEVVVS